MTRDRVGKLGMLVCVVLVGWPLVSMAGGPFEGSWGYSSQCGRGHGAQLTLRQRGKHVTGEWDDGNRIHAWAGQLKGVVTNGKLRFSQCFDENGLPATPACPDYEEPLDWLVRQGADMLWLSGPAPDPHPYLVLRNLDAPSPVEAPEVCDEETE